MEKKIFLSFIVLLLSGNGASAESCSNQGAIRLTNGTYGNVQICYNNSWGIICDDDWDLKDGNVVCNELQYQRALSVSYSSHYGTGSTDDHIWMDNVNCNGSESRLQDCPFKGWGRHDCNHGDAAGVRCKGIITSPQSFDVRIQGQSNSGPVEVYYNNQWTPVCMQGWSRSFGTVVCRQTSYTAYFNSHSSNTQTSGLQLTDLVCSGAEQNLLGCNRTSVQAVTKNCHNVIITCATSSSSYLIGNDVDIIEGNTKWDGIVRILYQKTWGPLCDYGTWTKTDAEAVCYQLGYSVGVANLSTSTGVPGGGNTIWAANVSCVGWEGSIGACNGAQWTNASSCDSYASVICSDSLQALKVRLSGGSQPGEGRVEIYFGDSWGTVCDDGWSISSANVVCRQLGYMYATEAVVTLSGRSPQFGEGSGSIWMNEVHCIGNESVLSDCPFAGWGVHNCDHGEDAGVVCGNTPTAAPPVLLVRLGNSNGTYSGRVEVKRDNESTWGTVCDDGWDLIDAEVICQQLFSTNAIAAYGSAHFGAASDSVPILLDEVLCSPGMMTLSQCVSNEYGVHDCTHNEDASVSCSSGCASRLRHTDSSHQYEWEGLVEVNHEGEWGPVCDDEWDISDGHVVCTQLGYPGGAIAVGTVTTGGTNDFWLDNLRCSGDEESLCLCPANPIGDENCKSPEGAFVACAFENPVQVRLIGDSVPWVGRVEAKLNNVTGRLCSHGWSTHHNNYRTLCRQLGFEGLVSVVDDSTMYIEGSGPYWLNGLECTGDEPNLFDCTRGEYKETDCSGGYGVTVFCDPGSEAPSFNPIKLVGGESIYNGRLEILYKGVWGTICRDFWSREDSIVACRELGFGPPLGYLVDVNSDKKGLILLESVNCSGEETKLSQCPSPGWNEHNCNHNSDIRINCSALNQPGLKVSLASTSKPNSGQLLVNYSGIVGVVCGDGWSHSSANVACRQLGYGGVESHGAEPNTSWTGSDSPWYWIQSIQCNGNEDSLADCSVSVLGSYTECASNTIASLTCSVDAGLRLVGGPSPSEGILQIFIGGSWGTVCRRGWGRKSADVACQLLGYTRSVKTVNGYKYLTPEVGSSPIWLDEVKCNGDERSLLDCPRGPIGTRVCGHSNDIGLICTSVPNYPVRLVSNTGNESNGIVQIYHERTWGSICNFTQFSPNDARVVCKSLGFTLGPHCPSGTCGTTLPSSSLIPVWSSSLNCDGSSVSLSDCGTVFGAHSCSYHTQDVNLVCISHNYPVRLSGGLNSSEGRLEVFVSSRWTPVCHQGFDSNDAYVICSQLGYKGVDEIVEESVFGSDGVFWLNDVQCNGNEADLFQCDFQVNVVDGFEDCTSVGIRCTTWSPDREGSIRLVGGVGAGRLEVYRGGSWGSVCNSEWSVEDSRTACRDLGYSVEPNPITADYRSFGKGGGAVKVSRLACKGNESRFSDCTYSSDVNGCDHDDDIAVVCQGPESCTNFSLRLVGGASDLIGRLEMCYNGHWGTVCGDSIGTSSSSIASVSCRQLGYSPIGGRVLPYDEFYKKTQGVIWLSGVSCRGNESRLIDCAHLPVGNLSESCSGHFQDVILQCQASTEFKIRVRGSQESFITSGRGRVEVQYRGVWGTVCDTEWDLNAANVICREMGWKRAARPSFASEFGQTWGPIWMDFVRCHGDEYSLDQCGQTGWGLVSSCTHGNDAGVVCTNSTQTLGAISVHLTTSSIVSVQYDGEWGLVCYDGWDYSDATVVCKELGYKSVYSIGYSSHRPNTLPSPPTVWLSKIHCQGNETNLSQCIHGWGSLNCSSHGGYATLSCSNSNPSSLSIATRLTNGTSSSNGIINIRYDGVWGRVCSSHWTIRDANIVCRGLGYSRARGLKILDVLYSDLDPIWMDNVQCIGNENRLQDCYFDGWGNHAHQTTCKSMFVSCKNENYDLRLYNRQNDDSGLLEVYYSGGWGFVCDSDWSLHNSHVACKQLGFGSAESSYILSSPPVGGLVLMDGVNCTGAESRLVDCPFKGWGYARARCNGSNYVGVVCSNHGNSEMNVRLVGSDSETRGLVQVQYSGRWGYVCGHYWGDFEAKVICNQLGLYPPPGGYSPASFTGYRPQPSDTVWLDNVQCNGGEERFSECHHDEVGTHSCSVSSPVGAVDCYHKDPNQFSVRLVGGSSANEGRVQVYYNGWKSVCRSGWDFRDARVVCRQLGYGDALIVPTSSLYGIRGRDELSVMDDVECLGEEPLLKNCQHSFGNLECSVTDVASAVCTDISHPLIIKVRLSPSSSPSNGTVQVQYNGSWGTVCSNGWDINDAHIICHQLGYPSAVKTGRSMFFPLPSVSDAPVWLSGVNCRGNESSIGQCLIERAWGDVGTGCTHSFDVAVECTEPKSSNISVRLISGGVPYKGRIQLLINGTWNGVCGDKFRATNGNVLCKQLGYSRSLIAFNGSEHFSSFLPDELVLLPGLNCSGVEGNLMDCPTTEPTVISREECNVGPANVICDVTSEVQTPPNSTRLVDVSLSGYKGKLFVYDGSTWGTVCDDFIESVTSNVVCRSLGYAGPTHVFDKDDRLYLNEFSVTDPIHLDDVICKGNESSIFDCTHTTETDRCGHSEDVSIECSSIRLDSVKVRLTDIRSGIVEVLYGDQWSYVCVTDNDWSIPEANVVCRELGYTGASRAYNTSEYEVQPGVLIDDVDCTGSETRLSHCIINEWNVTKYCPSFARVECTVTMDSVRLVGGVSSNEGRVEIFHNGVWSSVCDEGWGLPDAEVVCRSLEYSRASRTLAGSWFGKGEGAVWSSVDCTGNEASLSFCPTDTSFSSGCSSHSNDASVVCSTSSSVSQIFLCADGDTRLTNNGTVLKGKSQGRLEICVGGEWGRVCIGGWSYEEAALVCHQLGFRVEGASRISSSQFGFGYRPILIDGLQCSGLESSLLQCGHTLLASGTYDQSCDSTQDVAVSCQTIVSPPVRIRLVGGNVEWAGRVEIHLQDDVVWGRVCDNGWSLANARVVCRQLGYGYAIGATIGTAFGTGSRSLGYGRVTCIGLETGLSNCYHDNQLSCDISHVAGAVCSDMPTPPNVRLRLLSNGNKPEGILQVYFAEEWGRVCTTSEWSLTTADIACHHLGEGLAVSTIGVATSSQDTFFWLSGVRCFGNETHLQECQHLGWGYAGEECYEGSTTVWLNCSGNSNTQTSTSTLPTITAAPSSGPAGEGSSLPLLAVISPTIAAILLFTCLIIVSILFYINHRRHKGRMYRISSPDEGREVQERGIPKQRKKNVATSASQASQLHLLSTEAMSPPMSPSYSKSSSLTRSEQRFDSSMMTITSELINSTAYNGSTSPEASDFNSSPFSPARVESTASPSPSPMALDNDNITIIPHSNLNSSSNNPLTLDSALHTNPPLSASSSTYNKQPPPSSSSSSRYADLDVLSSQHSAAKRASSVSSSGSNTRAQYATIQEVKPRKISVNTETTTV